jgi:16S rRNA C1402 (ribose-2'-O) methylase RsmI
MSVRIGSRKQEVLDAILGAVQKKGIHFVCNESEHRLLTLEDIKAEASNRGITLTVEEDQESSIAILRLN